MRKAAIIIPAIASVAILAAALCMKSHRSQSVRTAEVQLPAPYVRVIAAMGKKSSFEKILESGGTSLVERKWDEFKVDFSEVPRLSSWEMIGSGRFKVLSSSKEFPGVMEVKQNVKADRRGLMVDSRMASPCGFIRDHETTVSISNSHPPVLRVENKIVYERSVPFWMAERMDFMVDDHNRRRVESMVEVIKSIVKGGQPENTAHQ